MELCTICKNPFKHDEKKVKLGAKGCVGINMASEKRYDDVIAEMGQVVHVDCRRTYTNPNNIESNNNKENDFVSPKAKRTLRSLERKFAYDSHCLFCGQPSKCDWKTKRRDVVPVRTEGQFQDSIKIICNERNDDWALTVKSRLEYAQDCFAYDVVYHNTCSVNFRTGKHIPLNFSESGISNKLRRSGRPQDSERSAAFLKVSCYLEDNDDEQISVPELVSLMNDYLKDTGLDGYSIPYMKKRLQEHFNENIIFAEVNGKADVATLKTNADQILHEFYTAPKSLMSGVEKNRVVEAVAKLIKNDIKQMTSSRDTYPSCRYMSSVDANEQFLPDTLRLFLRMLFVGSDIDMKVASIGQAIIQATRPRTVIAPLQIGLAVQLHHHFASKFLLDSLNRHGFCSSYTEVKKFELNAAAGQGSDIPPVESDTFMQWVADNVDHNVATLDGRGTFHGMGIIGTMTPGAQTERIVKRRDVDIKDVLSIGRIGIHFYRPDWCKVPPLVYEPLADKGTTDSSDPLELLWKISFPLRPSRPAWAGMMQSVQEGAYPGKSSITLLPMIDLSASDMTCIYSTLKFVCAEARKHDATPIITFDQPLWWKAQLIIANESTDSDIHSVVLRLGTFHTQMSFLGCIGHLMTATGLQDAMETVYAANSVIHMLSGKAISRAIRGHFLIDAALNALLLTDAYDIDCSQTSGASQNSKPENGNEDLNKAADILDRLLNGEDVTATASNSDVLNRIERRLNEHKDIVSNSRTGALWMMYLNMTSILKRSIKAERTGNFQLHLQSVAEMLPYFAASGNNLYAKSARLYLQKMHDLENSHPHVYAKFMTGHHVIRRTDRFWAGLSSDLVIEQVLMRSMKTNGGLTRGRGMAESQRLTWLLSMPACADVNNAMQSFTQVSFNTSEQHKETGESRRERDQKDTRSLILYFLERSPFSSDGMLRNIANGHTAGPTVNVDRAEQVGRSILQKMDGKNIVYFSFKGKEQAVTLANTCILEVDQETINVDPQLLFQRLLIVAQKADTSSSLFKYELCTVPASLFDSSGLPREANKAALADYIWSQLETTEWSLPSNQHLRYILDGGSLLHRVMWPRDVTYDTIVQRYAEYVSRKYGNAVVVFDGYESRPSIKDITHLRRRRGGQACDVNFTADMTVCDKKELFLANGNNKQQLIRLLRQSLENIGCKTFKAVGDADLMIVQKAIESATIEPTILIGEDMDLLVLLLHHATPDLNRIDFTSETKCGSIGTKKPKIWDILEAQRQLGLDICGNMLFAHAIAGCDTTSRLFGIGKGVPVKQLTSCKHFLRQSSVFMNISSKQDIVAAGEKALVSLYKGNVGESLDNLRHLKFREKVTSSTSVVQASHLPPTTGAAKYHSLRVYYQIREWIGSKLPDMIPEEWGWQPRDDRFHPIYTDLPPAPPDLLRIIRCCCKTDCQTSRCSCRKHGLECSPGCRECRGVSCTNSKIGVDDENDDVTEIDNV